jgi:hypothetical protein
MALPANPPAVYLAEYLRGWTLVRPTPTPVPTTTPTPVPTPGPICDVQSEVIIEQVLGKMLDPLRLRADIDVRLRNTCTIPVTFLVEGVVLSLNADVRGRDTHFLPTMLLPGEMVTLSLVVLGNYWIGGELEYRVEIMDVPGAA